ncbi:MAG TPA: twin-arginine translocation signal domain-containing protein [Burkholderiales bacterium]|nr:twin-arginine translocation signal domain-containing protein [Burkholderiales bacterium]
MYSRRRFLKTAAGSLMMAGGAAWTGKALFGADYPTELGPKTLPSGTLDSSALNGNLNEKNTVHLDANCMRPGNG